MWHQWWAELGGRVLAAQATGPGFDSRQLLAFHFPLISNLTSHLYTNGDITTGKSTYLLKHQRVIKACTNIYIFQSTQLHVVETSVSELVCSGMHRHGHSNYT